MVDKICALWLIATVHTEWLQATDTHFLLYRCRLESYNRGILIKKKSSLHNSHQKEKELPGVFRTVYTILSNISSAGDFALWAGIGPLFLLFHLPSPWEKLAQTGFHSVSALALPRCSHASEPSAVQWNLQTAELAEATRTPMGITWVYMKRTVHGPGGAAL